MQQAGEDKRRQRKVADLSKALAKAQQELLQRRLFRQGAVQLWDNQESDQQNTADPDDSRQDVKEQADRQGSL